MKWFKLHSEFANDPKMRTFSKCQRYDLVCLMCLASESKERGVILLEDEDVAATLDQEPEEYAEFVAKLTRKGVVERDGRGFVCFRGMESGDDDARAEWVSLRPRLTPLIFARDHWQCVYCGSLHHLTIDHSRPLSRGGSNDIDNLLTACRSCNSRKHDKSPEEWLR